MTKLEYCIIVALVCSPANAQPTTRIPPKATEKDTSPSSSSQNASSLKAVEGSQPLPDNSRQIGNPWTNRNENPVQYPPPKNVYYPQVTLRDLPPNSNQLSSGIIDQNWNPYLNVNGPPPGPYTVWNSFSPYYPLVPYKPQTKRSSPRDNDLTRQNIQIRNVARNMMRNIAGNPYRRGRFAYAYPYPWQYSYYQPPISNAEPYPQNIIPTSNFDPYANPNPGIPTNIQQFGPYQAPLNPNIQQRPPQGTNNGNSNNNNNNNSPPRQTEQQSGGTNQNTAQNPYGNQNPSQNPNDNQNGNSNANAGQYQNGYQYPPPVQNGGQNPYPGFMYPNSNQNQNQNQNDNSSPYQGSQNQNGRPDQINPYYMSNGAQNPPQNGMFQNSGQGQTNSSPNQNSQYPPFQFPPSFSNQG